MLGMNETHEKPEHMHSDGAGAKRGGGGATACF